MKKKIKSLFNILGLLLYKCLDFPFLVYVSDAFVKEKINSKKVIKVSDKTIYLATPNFLNRYRHKTFFTKEPETLKWMDDFTQDIVFYDIGANVGLYSIYAAKNKNAQVFSFEPSFFNLEFLARNVFMNNLTKNISIFPIALNDTIGISNFRLTSTEWGGALSTFDKDFDDSGNKIQSEFIYNTIGFDLDYLVESTKIPKPDYIKIDVDGLEHFILEGAQKVIKNAKSILIEINDNFYEQSEKSNRILKDLGFYLHQKIYTEKNTKQIANQIWKKNN